MKHPYHCVLCGTQLDELGLGILGCPKCETNFLPTSSDDESEFSVTWQPVPPIPEDAEWRDLIEGEMILTGDQFWNNDKQDWFFTSAYGETYDTYQASGHSWHAPHRRRVK